MGVLLAGGLPGLLNQSSAQVIDGSLKFDKLISHHLSRTPTSSNRKTWTWSSWIKNSVKLGNNPRIFTAGSGGTNTLEITILGSGENNELRVLGDVGGSRKLNWTTGRRFRDTGWFHITVALDTTLSASSNRLKLYYNGVLQGSGAASTYPSLNDVFEVNNNSVHYIGKSGPYTEYFDGSMSQCYFIDGLALGPDSFGFTDPLTNTWRPRKFRAEGTTVNDGTNWSSNFSGNGGTQPSNAFDGNGPRQNGYVHSGSELTVNFPSPGLTGRIIVYGGTGAGSHNSTTTDTFTLSDGSVLTSQEKYDVAPYFSTLDFGAKKNITSLTCSAGYTLYAVSVDGVVLKDSTTQNLDFGTNGFYLPMDNEDDFAVDKSGKGNNWTENGFIGTFNDPDVLKDSPSGAVSGGRAQTGITTTSSAPSNYATMNPLQMSPNRTPTISDGNLSISLSSGSSEWTNTGCTMNIGSGKYYWEVQFTTINGTIARIGVADSDDYEFNRNTSGTGLPWMGSGTGKSWSLDVGGNTLHNGSTVNASYTSTITTSDAIGVLLDLDNNTLSYSKNGTNLGVAHSNVTSDFVTPGFGLHGATTNTINVNFGQKPFKFPPPAGYKLLNSASATPETVITRPNQYMNTVTYTGTGSDLTLDVGFKPDLSYFSVQSATGYIKYIFDSVRGATKYLATSHSQGDDAEGTSSSTLKSFNANGVTIGNNGQMNENANNTWVSWHWKAGGSKNTFNVDDVGYASAAAAGITEGTLSLTGTSIGTKQGFSICKFNSPAAYDGSTWGHGLTQSPDFVMMKHTGNTGNWQCYHSGIPSNYIQLNSIAAPAGSNNWTITSTTATCGAGLWSHNNTATVAYHWHDVPGLQKFGKFIGNASADGNFIELGFRPALVWIKPLYSYNGGASIIAQTGWYMYDNKRGTFNPNGKVLALNSNRAEEDNSTDVDFLSNGFKLRNNRSINTSQGSIYCAWAESPFSNLYGGQSNAR
jgi:hypothetical protein